MRPLVRILLLVLIAVSCKQRQPEAQVQSAPEISELVALNTGQVTDLKPNDFDSHVSATFGDLVKGGMVKFRPLESGLANLNFTLVTDASSLPVGNNGQPLLPAVWLMVETDGVMGPLQTMRFSEVEADYASIDVTRFLEAGKIYAIAFTNPANPQGAPAFDAATSIQIGYSYESPLGATQ
jgi:hypothetical protein